MLNTPASRGDSAHQSPEQRELLDKQATLATLESELAERELELETLKAELHAFEARYISVVGARFARRDALEAQIAETRARQSPTDRVLRARAVNARRQADESATAARDAVILREEEFTPSEQLKGLYRRLAKRIHPDLSTDEKSRERRTKFMAEANLAYAQGDEGRLKALLEDWENSPEAVDGEGVAADLVRTIRKIHQVTRRISQIEQELLDLRAGDWFRLRAETENANAHGRDLVSDISQQLDVEIARLSAVLQALLSREASL